MTVSKFTETHHYPLLTLDVLELSESEFATVEDPCDFFLCYLRQCVLRTLSMCDEIMTLQSDVPSREVCDE